MIIIDAVKQYLNPVPNCLLRLQPFSQVTNEYTVNVSPQKH